MFHSIEAIIQDVAAGKMVIMLDNADRENEGDLIVAAEKITPEIINFIARYARGIICLSLARAQCEQLNLPLMASNNHSPYKANFTVSIEAAMGVTTGVSAFDRAHTILTAVNKQATPHDIVYPGHVFPIMAQDNGVLARPGHTEASVDLARLAGLVPAGVLCEILNEDGHMARQESLVAFAKTHDIKLGTVADLVAWRLAHDPRQ